MGLPFCYQISKRPATHENCGGRRSLVKSGVSMKRAFTFACCLSLCDLFVERASFCSRQHQQKPDCHPCHGRDKDGRFGQFSRVWRVPHLRGRSAVSCAAPRRSARRLLGSDGDDPGDRYCTRPGPEHDDKADHGGDAANSYSGAAFSAFLRNQTRFSYLTQTKYQCPDT